MQMASVPFEAYLPAPELWVLTVYYNPCGFKSRRKTYDVFAETMRQSGINLLTIECAFGNEPFALPDRVDIVKLRSRSLLWQKERLLNIGASYLPDTCRVVAWVDCDVIFDNPAWARETCALLRRECTIVQPWQSCMRLTATYTIPEVDDSVVSFASVTTGDQATLDCGRYDVHGHTGYAWAMRRDIFQSVGLYEHAVSGSADHFMAHAIYGVYGFCVENALKHDRRQIDHLMRWGEKFHAATEGKLGVVTGSLRHLWHGSQNRRNYFRRMWTITERGFNPDQDLIARPGRPLEWLPHVHEDKPELVAYFGEYFASRQEDVVDQ